MENHERTYIFLCIFLSQCNIKESFAVVFVFRFWHMVNVRLDLVMWLFNNNQKHKTNKNSDALLHDYIIYPQLARFVVNF